MPVPTSTRTAPHVIVGVDRSMAGLAAIRAAVAEAMRRGVPLHAARVRTGEIAAVDDFTEVDMAFQEALGGFPPGLRVCRELLTPPVVKALTKRASHPGDLLFLGNSSHGLQRLWHRLRSRPIISRCLRNAQCTVVVVRAPAMCDDPRAYRHVPRMGAVWTESKKGDRWGRKAAARDRPSP
jgi:nucleotide-binding universal stress UspA family protein